MLSNNNKRKKLLGKALILTLLLTMVIPFTSVNMAMALPADTVKIETIAGSATEDYLGDGGQATDAAFNDIYDFVFDSAGNMYLTDTNNSVIRKVDTSGVITTIAGNGTPGYTGDGGPATSAQLNKPGAIIIDNSGNLYISDTWNQVIRRIDTSGIITTVAGNGVITNVPYVGCGSYSGDGGQATEAGLNLPYGLCLDHQGNLLIAELENYRVRKVDMTSGIITTIAGKGKDDVYNQAYYSGENGLAVDAYIPSPSDVIVDCDDNIFIATNMGHTVLKIDATTGIITTYAGNGIAASTLGVATESSINRPWGLAFDADENMYIVERDGFVITKMDKATGLLSRVAGTGIVGYAGDGESPLSAQLCYPTNVYVDNNGIIYVADKTNNRIREIATYYSASYTAGANGTLTGTTSQTIKTNTNSTEVVAVPDSGYGFVQWSDGVTSSSRIDTNVTGDIDVSAQFDLEYTITLEEQGGDDVADITQANTTIIESAPSATREGYTFDGWYEEATYDTAIVYPYTVTGNDTWYAKWTLSPTPTPAPTPTATPAPDTQKVGITGTLTDQDGNPLSGYTVEIHSTPQAVVTDSNGVFSFTDVTVGAHTLFVKESGSTTLATFPLAITQGSALDWEVDGTDVDITVASNTVLLSFDISVDEEGAVAIDEIKDIVNPGTGDGFTNWLFVVLAAILVVIGSGMILILGKQKV